MFHLERPVPQPRLLAIDDDAQAAALVVRVAERCGFEAFATSDSRGVTCLVATLQPHVIALDIAVRHVDAIDLLRLLVAHRYKGQVLLTGGLDPTVLGVAGNAAQMLGLARPTLHSKPLDIANLRDTLVACRAIAAA
jgi:CheY-like chemotaxis protein